MSAETAIGAKTRLAAVPETVWGTTPATPSMILVPYVSESLESNIGIVENNAIRPDRKYFSPGQGNLKPAGDVSVVWSANALGWLILRGVGASATTTGSAGSGFTHTIQETTNVDLPSVTIEKGFLDIGQYIVYKGARINTLTFEMRPESTINGSIGFMAKDEVSASTQLGNPTDIAWIPLNSYNGTCLQEAATMANVTEMTLNFNNNLSGTHVLFSRTYGSLLASRFRITGSFGVFFLDLAHFNRYRSFTETNFDITMQDANGHFVQFKIFAARYNGSTPKVNDEGPIFFQGEFSAYVATSGPGNGKQLETIIKNTRTNAQM